MNTVNNIAESYFSLIKNIDMNAKIELISKISNSILKKEASKEALLLKSFGKFISEKSADEIIEDIYKSRVIIPFK